RRGRKLRRRLAGTEVQQLVKLGLGLPAGRRIPRRFDRGLERCFGFLVVLSSAPAAAQAQLNGRSYLAIGRFLEKRIELLEKMLVILLERRRLEQVLRQAIPR